MLFIALVSLNQSIGLHQKSIGSIHIFGEYKLTKNLIVHLLPQIIALLSGEKAFTKLDLSHVYQRLCLKEKSNLSTTIGSFSDIIVFLLQPPQFPFHYSLNHACVSIDDILISGVSKTDHLRNLEEVVSSIHLNQNKQASILNKTACLPPQVEYLGHLLEASISNETASFCLFKLNI